MAVTSYVFKFNNQQLEIVKDEPFPQFSSGQASFGVTISPTVGLAVTTFRLPAWTDSPCKKSYFRTKLRDGSRIASPFD